MGNWERDLVGREVGFGDCVLVMVITRVGRCYKKEMHMWLGNGYV